MNAETIIAIGPRPPSWKLLDCIQFMPASLFNSDQVVYFIAPTIIFFDSVVIALEPWDNTFSVAAYSTNHECVNKLVVLNHTVITQLREKEFVVVEIGKYLDDILPCISVNSPDKAEVPAAAEGMATGPSTAIAVNIEGEVGMTFIFESDRPCTMTVAEGEGFAALLSSLQHAMSNVPLFCITIADMSVLR